MECNGIQWNPIKRLKDDGNEAEAKNQINEMSETK